MTTKIELLWIAREYSRIYRNMDAMNRVPSETIASMERQQATCWHQNGPFADPVSFWIFPCQIDDGMRDVVEVRERVLLPLVRDELKRRGAWSSAFRKRLKEAWRVTDTALTSQPL